MDHILKKLLAANHHLQLICVFHCVLTHTEVVSHCTVLSSRKSLLHQYVMFILSDQEQFRN